MDGDIAILERLLQAAAARHSVLVSNIANTDTPGYKAKDMPFGKIIDEESLGLATTDLRHIAGSGGTGTGTAMRENAGGQWGDGNNVEVDMEMAKIAENSVLYEAGVKLLSTRLKMFRNALTRG